MAKFCGLPLWMAPKTPPVFKELNAPYSCGKRSLDSFYKLRTPKGTAVLKMTAYQGFVKSRHCDSVPGLKSAEYPCSN